MSVIDHRDATETAIVVSERRRYGNSMDCMQLAAAYLDLQKTVMTFTDSLVGKRGAILGGDSWGKLEKLKQAVDVTV